MSETILKRGKDYPQEANDRLPVSALLALALTGFISIMTETLPAGLLPAISETLNVSQSLAGQLVSVYALGSLLAAIPLTIATSSWQRRRVLLMTVIGFLVFNTITAVSSSYPIIMVARFFAGVAAGLAWSLIPGYARRMVTPDLRGKAMAIAMVGTPVALALGVPLGTWLGHLVGWRMAFGVMTILSVVLIVWIFASVPNFAGQAVSSKMPLGRVLRTPGVMPVLLVAVLWMLAHNVLYTFIAPFIAPAGMSDNVDLILFIFGVAAIVGIFITGKLVDNHLRKSVLISLVIFALSALLMGIKSDSQEIIYLSLILWGVTFGGAATLLQTALADAAGDGAEVALSVSVVAWNVAIALGGVTGGILLEKIGVSAFPWVMLVLIVIAWLISLGSKKHGFIPS